MRISKSLRYDLLGTAVEFAGGRYFFGWWMIYALVPAFFERFESWRSVHALELPGPAGILAYLLVFDFFFYWYHRCMHRAPLWVEHEFHHSATELNPLTGFRFHFLSYIFLLFFVVLPTMVFFKLTPIQFLFFALTLNTFSFLTHSNWNSGWGWLGNWVLISPRFHRAHHRIGSREGNFGGTFVFWDRIFGTYLSEADSFYDPVGLEVNAYEDSRAGTLVMYLAVLPKFLSRCVGFRSAFPRTHR